MRLTRTLLLVTIGPLLLAAAGLLHPGGLSAATADHWVRLHVALLPVFPLLGLGFVVLLRGRPRADVAGVELRRLVLALYDVADQVGRAGVYALLVAVLAGTVALLVWHGPGVLAGTAVLLGAGWSFLDSHIFWPRGVLTMLAIAAGFALWALAAERRPRPNGSIRAAERRPRPNGSIRASGGR
jgi:hypothetical protein